MGCAIIVIIWIRGPLHHAPMPDPMALVARALTPFFCLACYVANLIVNNKQAQKFYHEPYWFDIMTEQDYVKLQNMEVEMRQTAVELLNMAFDDTLTHQLPPSLAWHLRGTALLIERGDGDASACVEALRSTELLLAELLRLSSDHACPLESIWVKNTVIVAEKKLRDLLVVRAQLNVPFERGPFEEAVAVAYGFRVVRGSQLYSQIMQSYRKVIWEKGFENAFPSECEKEKQKNRRQRPKRDKK